jgi:hypothetical protein
VSEVDLPDLLCRLFLFADEVGVKDGYNIINWNADAKLIWGSNLNTNNTILWRTRIPLL